MSAGKTTRLPGESKKMQMHTASVRCVSFSSDEEQLLSASDDKMVKVWSVPGQRFMYSLSGHTNWLRSADFSPDGRLVVSCGDDKTVKLWDAQSHRCVHTFYDHSDSVSSCKFHPDGTCIASASADKTIKLFDLRTYQLLQHYPAHDDAVTDLAFHPSGNFLLSSSADASLKVWDVCEGRLFYSMSGHEGRVNACTFSPNGDYFASCGADRQVLVWRTGFDQYLGGAVERSGCKSEALCWGGATSEPSAPTAVPPPSPASTRLAPPPARQQGATRLPPRELLISPSSPGLAAIGAPDWQPSSGDAAVELGRCIDDAPGAPPELADTLGAMVGQIDILAQTMALLEQRLTLTEEKGKVSETLLQQILESQQILEAGFLERVADKKASLSARTQ
jgi:centriolar protein POC1